MVEIIEDEHHLYSIDQISSFEFRNKFLRLRTYHIENDKPGAAYWIRFRVRNALREMKWLTESYNFKVNEIQLYTPIGREKFKAEKQSHDSPFNNV